MRTDHWGYLVIFLIVMLECQALLGLFMPGESLVLVAGFLAKQGLFDPGVLIFVISAAAILGNSIGDSTSIFEGYSFPSGHTMAAMLLYGLLAVFAVIALKSWLWRILTVIGTIAMVVLVGFSRMYLGAHYLSDVLGATAAGLAWLVLCLTAVDTLCHYRVHLAGK